MNSQSRTSPSVLARRILFVLASIALAVIAGLVALSLFTGPSTVSAKSPGLVIEGDIVSGSDIILMENAWRSYTVRLASQPLTDVTVTLSPHEDYNQKVHAQWGSSSNPSVKTTTFTADNWNTPQTVQVWGWGDHNEVTDREVITHVARDDGKSSTVARLYAYIQDQTGPAVTLPTPTATPVATATPAPKVSIIVTTPDEYVEDRKDSNGDIFKGMRVAKGGSATFGIRLGSKPTADVPVELYEYGDSLGTIHYDPGSVTFTPDDWDTDQTITVSSTNTPEGRSGNSADLLIRTGDTDDTSGYYNLLPWVYHRVYEIEPPAIRLQPTAVTVDEGSSYSYSVWLNTQPTADVTVTIAGGSGDSDLTVSPTTLTFTTANWDYTQSVRVSAAHDDDLANGSRTFSHTASSNDTSYDGLSISLTATEKEDDSASIVVSATSVSVPEGATAGYNVRLSNEPSGDVTVTLSATGDSNITLSAASLDFTSSNWRVAKTVTLTAAEDTDDLNGTKAIRHTASGADFGGAPAVAVTATEADNDRRGLAVKRPGWPLTINPTTWDPVIAEGGSYSYTVKLGTEPTADVTVALSASGDPDVSVLPTSLIFNSGNYSTAQTVTISAAHDDTDYADDTATVSHTVSSQDSFYVEQSIGDVAVTVEDDDANIILSTTTLTVPEGGSASYTVGLTNKPTADVTVTIAEGTTAPHDDTSIRVSSPSNKNLTFTPDNWDTPQTVTLRANSDSDRNANNHEFNGTRAITHTASGATEFVGVSGSLIATERDSQARVLTRNSANSNISSLTVVEETTSTYAVSLNAQPAANVTVTLAEATSGNYTDADITVANPSSKTLTFTPQNYATAQTVTLSAAADQDMADGRRTITHTASDAGSTHSGYGSVNGSAIAKDITAREDDNDTGGLEFADSGGSAVTALSVPENGSATYKVRLTHKPNGNVNVSVRGATGDNNDTDITVRDTNDSQNGNQTGSIRFTANNWDTYRSVTLAAADDDDNDNGSRAINHTANGGGYSNVTGSVTANEVEDDAAIVLSKPAITIGEGSTSTYTVKLGTAPTANVTVNLIATGWDTSITIQSPSSGQLTFCPTTSNCASPNTVWSAAQTVTLAAAEDTDGINASRRIRHRAASSDANYNNLVVFLTATEVENDKGILVPGFVDVPEGGSATADVSLHVQPTHDVTVTITENTTGWGIDPDITVTSPSSKTLTFTSSNWNIAQTVTLSAAQDDDFDGGSRNINFSAASTDAGYQGASALLFAIEEDDDVGLVLNPATVSVNEAGVGTYRIRLSHKPVGDVYVSVRVATGSGQDTDITVKDTDDSQNGDQTGSIRFTTTNWNTYRTVTLAAREDNDIVNGSRTINHTASGGRYNGVTGTVTATEVENDYTIVLSKSAVTIDEGSTATYTAMLATQPTANVTVTVAGATTGRYTDTDITAAPSSLAFTSTTWNTAQTVTLTAANDRDRSDGSRTITHTATSTDANYNNLAVSLLASEEDDDSPGDRDTLRDLTLNSSNSYPYDIWSDGTTMYVMDDSDDKVYAYTLSGGARDTSKEFDLHSANSNPKGIWSDGTTIWVADRTDRKLYAYTLSGGARNTSKEFNLFSGNHSAVGIWSNGATMYVANDSSWGADRVYAYNLSSGTRDTTKEFALHSDNTNVEGIWSDGVTIWTSDDSDDKLYAYTLSSGARNTSREFALHSDNGDPTGIWSDSATIWVADYSDGKLYTYHSPPLTRSLSADDATASSMRLTIAWHTGNWWYKYTSPSGGQCSANPVTTASTRVTGLAPDRTYTFAAYSDSSCSSSKLLATASALETRGSRLTLSNFSTTTNAYDVTLTLANWVISKDGNWYYKTQLSGSRGNCVQASTNPYTVDDFSFSANETHTFSAYSDSACGSASKIASAPSFKPSDGTPALAAGSITLTGATLTLSNFSGAWWHNSGYGATGCARASSNTATLSDLAAGKSYTYYAFSASGCAQANAIDSVSFTTTAYGDRDTSKEFSLDDNNINVGGIWSNGTTMWVSDGTYTSEKVYAYTLSSKARDTSKEFNLHSDNGAPKDIWSNGTTMWVSDETDNKLYAYTLSGGARDTSKDITLNSANSDMYGIWSDGSTMWVADQTDNKLYAYTLSGGARDTSKDITLTNSANLPSGVWSDGVTIWVASYYGQKVHTHILATDARQTSKEYSLESGVNAIGVWSDGVTMWVGEQSGPKLYAYHAHPPTKGLTATGVGHNRATLNIKGHTGDWWYKRTAPSTTGCGKVSAGATSATLSGLTSATSYTYKAYDKSGCGSADEIASVSFTTTSLTADDPSATTMRLTIANHTGDWYYKYTSPSGGQCSTKVAGASARATGLAINQSHTFAAYSDSNCSNLLTSASSLSTLNPSLTATAGSNAGEATLTLSNWVITDFISEPPWVVDKDGNWHTKYTTPSGGQCSTPQTALTATVTGLTSGVAHTFAAYSDNQCTKLIATASTVSPLSGPSNVSASRSGQNVGGQVASGGSIVATWDPMTGATGYDVRYSTDSGATWTRATTNQPETSYTLTNADSSLAYIIGARAVYEDGRTSGWVNSNEVPAGSAISLPVDIGSPSLTVSDSGSASWTYTVPEGAEYVYTELRWVETAGRETNDWSGKENVVFYDIGVTTRDIADLTAGVEYKAKVFVGLKVNGENQYAKSNTVVFTPPSSPQPPPQQPQPPQQPPDAVSSVTATRDGANVTASWDAANGATKYHVTKTDDGGASWTLVSKAQSSTTATFAADSGKAYIVGVRAGNDAGWSGWVNSNSVPAVSSGPPGNVASVSALHKGDSVVASWKAAGGATGYDVVYSTDGGASWARAATNHGETTYTLTGANSAKTYIIGVRAVNAAGESAWTNSLPASPSEDQASITGQ